MPFSRGGSGGGGGGLSLLTGTRVLTQDELRNIDNASYIVLPAAPDGMSYVVRDIFLHRSAGTPVGSLRFNPRFIVALGPEATAAHRVNLNSGSENIAVNVWEDRLRSIITADAYSYFTRPSHSLAAAQALLVGMYGTVRGSEASSFDAITGDLTVVVGYTVRAVPASS